LLDSGLSGNSHDLLPIPITQEALERTVENINFVQETLGRQILFENISYYFNYKENEMHESEFISELCQRTGCGILLDLNNIYVNAINHGFDAFEYIDEIPMTKVGQMHLAGPSQENGYLFDTHSTPVTETTWNLLRYVGQKGLDVPIIVEWDQDIPSFEDLEREVVKARAIKENAKEANIEYATF